MELLFLYLFRFLLRKISIQPPAPANSILDGLRLSGKVIWFTIKIEISTISWREEDNGGVRMEKFEI